MDKKAPLAELKNPAKAGSEGGEIRVFNEVEWKKLVAAEAKERAERVLQIALPQQLGRLRDGNLARHFVDSVSKWVLKLVL